MRITKKVSFIVVISMLMVFMFSCGSDSVNNTQNAEENVVTTLVDSHENVLKDIDEESKSYRVYTFKQDILSDNPLLETNTMIPEGYEITKCEKKVYFDDKNATLLVNGTYPQISGIPDLNFQIQINSTLKSTIQSRDGYTPTVYPKSLDETKGEFFRQYYEYDKGFEKTQDPYKLYYPDFFCFLYDYEIPLFTENILSVIYIIHFQVGCTAAYDCVLPITFDLKNKEIYRDAQDLFTTPSYWETIGPLFVEEMIKKLPDRIQRIEENTYWLESSDNLTRYLSFALSQDGLLVMYDENEHNSLETVHVVKIPYSKVDQILKPELIP